MNKKLFLSVFGAVFLMACGGGDSVKAPESTTTLTQDQANAVFEALFGNSGSLNAKLSARVRGEAIDPEEDNCPGGGITRTKGEVNVSESSDTRLDVSQDLTVQFIDCVTREVDGKTITLNGKLAFDGDIVGQKSGDTGSLDLKYKLIGPLDVTGDSVDTGICGVGLLLKGDVDFTQTGEDSLDLSVSATIDGTICDKVIQESANVDVSI